MRLLTSLMTSIRRSELVLNRLLGHSRPIQEAGLAPGPLLPIQSATALHIVSGGVRPSNTHNGAT